MKPYNKEEDKKTQIHRMFNRLAPSYDAVCHTLSFHIDRLWRKKLVKMVAAKRPTRIVDVATGTGDVAISMARRMPEAEITGVDLSEGMLEVARKKMEKAGVDRNIRLMCEDAEHLSLPSDSHDVVTISFGIRNFEHVDRGLAEFYRILKAGGTLYVMEFSTPKNKLFNTFYRFYSKVFMPRVGQLISKDRKACVYLPESIVEFYQAEEFTALLRQAGFQRCTARSLSMGIAHIYTGTKPKKGTTGE